MEFPQFAAFSSVAACHTSHGIGSRGMPATAVDHEHRVTPRELFFDLVFVFAFTQVATLLANDPTFAGIGRGVLVLGRSGGRGRPMPG